MRAGGGDGRDAGIVCIGGRWVVHRSPRVRKAREGFFRQVMRFVLLPQAATGASTTGECAGILYVCILRYKLNARGEGRAFAVP